MTLRGRIGGRIRNEEEPHVHLLLLVIDCAGPDVVPLSEKWQYKGGCKNTDVDNRLAPVPHSHSAAGALPRSPLVTLARWRRFSSRVLSSKKTTLAPVGGNSGCGAIASVTLRAAVSLVKRVTFGGVSLLHAPHGQNMVGLAVDFGEQELVGGCSQRAKAACGALETRFHGATNVVLMRVIRYCTTGENERGKKGG